MREAGVIRWLVPGNSSGRSTASRRQEIALPALPPGHIVVPSFASPDSPDHRWALVHDDASCLTASFGRPVGQHPQVDNATGLIAKIDYFETSQRVSNARLRLLVDALEPPRDYLVAVGVRPVRIATDVAPPVDTPVLDIPTRSQTAAAQEEVRPRICSPTCVSMAMNRLGVDHAFDELVIAAYHRATDLYGVWPQNIWAASRWGHDRCDRNSHGLGSRRTCRRRRSSSRGKHCFRGGQPARQRHTGERRSSGHRSWHTE